MVYVTTDLSSSCDRSPFFFDLPPNLDHQGLEFSGFTQGDGLVTPPRFRQHDRHLVSDRAVWPFLIVVSTPSLQLFSRICKGQEPVRVQAFRAEPAIEGEEG